MGRELSLGLCPGLEGGGLGPLWCRQGPQLNACLSSPAEEPLKETEGHSMHCTILL